MGYKMDILVQVGINYLLHFFNFLHCFHLYVKFLKKIINILRSGFVRNMKTTHSTKFIRKNKSINFFKVTPLFRTTFLHYKVTNRKLTKFFIFIPHIITYISLFKLLKVQLNRDHHKYFYPLNFK